jgi:hypothetical protein
MSEIIELACPRFCARGLRGWGINQQNREAPGSQIFPSLQERKIGIFRGRISPEEQANIFDLIVDIAKKAAKTTPG